MGLQEKRAIQNFQENKLAQLKAEVENAAGYSIIIDINWDNLAPEGHSERLSEYLEKIYFVPLINAIKKISIDDLGKQALKDALKSVFICNQSHSYTLSNSIVFEKETGKLVLDHEPATNIDSIADREDAILNILNKNL